MSEEAESAAQSGADPVAIGFALGRASARMDDEVVAYLHDQRHHMRELLKQVGLRLCELRNEALVYAGKQDEAKAQFARAATLGLTPTDMSELKSVNRSETRS